MSSRDSWERLVAAVIKREQIWQLCHRSSPSISTIASDDSSDQFLSFSSDRFESLSTSPSPPSPLINRPVSQGGNHASSVHITRNIFSAWYRRRKTKDKYLVDIPEDLRVHLRRLRRFSLHELHVAIKNFRNITIQSILSAGYFKIYGGQLEDGSKVAVKRFRDRGVRSAKQIFLEQVKIDSFVAHPNVLHLVGFCIRPNEWLLVYPFMVNGCVGSHLRDRSESHLPLNWPTRKGIALGVAKGVVHLHEECDKKILHRDIKASNILLNEDFEAVICDLELGIIAEHNAGDIEDAVCGTIGHIAPEYLVTGKCSERNDVFGYGVFLLELITGQRAFDLARLANDEDVRLLDWVKRNYMERKWEVMVDEDCGGNFMEDVVEQLTQIALICTRSSPEERPMMSEVVRLIENEDRLAERWQEWCINDALVETDYPDNYSYSGWIIDDNTTTLAPEELSGPR